MPIPAAIWGLLLLFLALCLRVIRVDQIREVQRLAAWDIEHPAQ
ncbi:MAG: CidA/LrgA family protein [Clostridia bacterium]|nr:CidA/LrgA family protein [Clostridia bacterium]MBQ2462973.1 CidA/LrgA family protein [Clostridia bacterium]MBQ9288530.1 CidA/LrgA family protein [Clostridia bacterium]MBR0215793.1 CidA/LrgA family protein [Clostridia bacterium]